MASSRIVVLNVGDFYHLAFFKFTDSLRFRVKIMGKQKGGYGERTVLIRIPFFAVGLSFWLPRCVWKQLDSLEMWATGHEWVHVRRLCCEQCGEMLEYWSCYPKRESS